MTSQNWSKLPEGCAFIPTIKEDGSWPPVCEHSKSEVDGVLYLGYFFLGLAALWFVFICCIRKRIQLAIGCVKEAAKAMAAMPIITVYPVFQVIGVVIFLVPWIAYMTYLASCGKVDPQCACPNADMMGDMMGGMADQLGEATGVEIDLAGEDEDFKECDEGCIMYVGERAKRASRSNTRRGHWDPSNTP